MRATVSSSELSGPAEVLRSGTRIKTGAQSVPHARGDMESFAFHARHLKGPESALRHESRSRVPHSGTASVSLGALGRSSALLHLVFCRTGLLAIMEPASGSQREASA